MNDHMKQQIITILTTVILFATFFRLQAWGQEVENRIEVRGARSVQNVETHQPTNEIAAYANRVGERFAINGANHVIFVTFTKLTMLVSAQAAPPVKERIILQGANHLASTQLTRPEFIRPLLPANPPTLPPTAEAKPTQPATDTPMPTQSTGTPADPNLVPANPTAPANENEAPANSNDAPTTGSPVITATPTDLPSPKQNNGNATIMAAWITAIATIIAAIITVYIKRERKT